MSDAFTRFLTRDVPQTEQEDPRQVANNAGGFSFPVTEKTQLDRLLILGTDGGTYHVGETDLTKLNLKSLDSLVSSDPKYVVDQTVEVSANGRAYKNDPALFALAYVMTRGSDEAKSYARLQFNKVVRTFYHLTTYNKYYEILSGGASGGTSTVRAVRGWYEDKSTDQLAYQVVKYRQRNGLHHYDMLNFAHPAGIDPALAKWILGQEVTHGELPTIVQEFMEVRQVTEVNRLLSMLDSFRLPWEAIPTQFHKNVDVWKKLFYSGTLRGTALLRNITRLARIGAFNDMVFAADYAAKLADDEEIVKAKLHPINYLNAVIVHQEGQIDRRNKNRWVMATYRIKDWDTSSVIVDALNAGFYSAFKNAEPSGKRILLGVDVSGSMESNAAAGLEMSAAQVAGAMALAIAKSEKYHMIRGFASDFKDLGITANTDLRTAMRKVRDHNFGGTDASLPMRWALQNNVEVDTFVVLTDNETWRGPEHPHVSLDKYRQKMGIGAKLIAVSACANGHTVADPADAGQLDCVGADANLPKLVSDFSAGNI